MAENKKKIDYKHLAFVAIRKAAIIGAIYLICLELERHQIFLRIGHTGEFVLGSITDHLIFDMGN